ncbi:general stress protein [uncultured Phycicoccus sp.]|uniref:general stress protein n=1 Tax=uncultured Phycicoccus sp. TaxID=661422 RepID=UPI0026328B15|nr:general stress protein [uncultured Phycicoccus sp.]
MTSQPMRPGLRAALSLEYPMSLGVHDSYEEAQKAVDYLSDHEFPVEDVLIVGTDLKQLERVTGRLTQGRVIGAGALSGMWLGLFVGTIFAVFDPSGVNLANIAATVAFGAVFGTVWATVGYRLTRGQRDFTSVSQVVAAKYEVLCEHKHVQRGRDLLAEMDPMRAAAEQVRLAQEQERARLAAEQQQRPQT